MNRADLELNLEIYGGDYARWPSDLAEAARLLCDADPKAEALRQAELAREAEIDAAELVSEEALDALFAAEPAAPRLSEKAKAQMLDSFLQATEAQAAARAAQSHAPNRTASPSFALQIRNVFDAMCDAVSEAAAPFGGRAGFAAGVAAAAVAGVLAAQTSVATAENTDDAATLFELVLDDDISADALIVEES